MTRYQFTMLVLVLAIAGLLFTNALMPIRKDVIVLRTFEATDELGYTWFCIKYMVNGKTDQVECGSLEQYEKVKAYLGVK